MPGLDRESEILSRFEKKAEADGSYAIAFAILSLTKEVRKFQENMTFGDFSMQGDRTPGVGEKIGMEIADIQLHIGEIAQALRRD